jgi:rhamnogalacturonyl hydrolase YesR
MKNFPFRLAATLVVLAAAHPGGRALAAAMPQPNYPVPYVPATVAEITAVLDRVHGYLDTASPARLLDRPGGQEVTDLTKIPATATLTRGTFALVSYEWGVTYAGMLHAGEVTGDHRFTDFVAKRFKLLAALTAAGQTGEGADWGGPQSTFRRVLKPNALDDCGAMAAAMIKAQRAGVVDNLRPYIDPALNFISNTQFRLADGTLARNRPLANSLWLDDLFMGVPALAQMGKLTGDAKYYDDAARQIVQFADRMFVKDKNLFQHGWVQAMDPHPVFHWARANGWAIMAMTELLDVLPADHPRRAPILDLYRAHVRGLAACQGGNGLWHQLLDRPDSYEETSASAIFTYCIARGVDQGWLDPLAYVPMVSLGWNAVAQKVNAEGQVEGTCIGTGMGFDPTFYYTRPTSVLAAHGYGPVLLAGAEVIKLRQGKAAQALISDGAVQLHAAPGI